MTGIPETRLYVGSLIVGKAKSPVLRTQRSLRRGPYVKELKAPAGTQH